MLKAKRKSCTTMRERAPWILLRANSLWPTTQCMLRTRQFCHLARASSSEMAAFTLALGKTWVNQFIWKKLLMKLKMHLRLAKCSFLSSFLTVTSLCKELIWRISRLNAEKCWSRSMMARSRTIRCSQTLRTCCCKVSCSRIWKNKCFSEETKLRHSEL